MRQILIPTDFSKVSKNAIQYGLDLYMDTDSEFEITHIYNPSFDPVQPELIDSSAPMIEVLKENMDSLMKDIENRSGFQIVNSIELGFTEDTLLEKSSDYDLVIMGTTGTNSILDKLFGSVSSDVAANAKCPVLLIPPEVKFKGMENIIFYSDCENNCEKIIDKITAFAQRYGSKLHILTRENEDKISDLLDNYSNIDTTVTQIKGKSIVDEINEFIDKKNAELLIMSTRKRSFWKKIIHKTKTRAFALNSKIPLLVYHHNDRK